jgi:catechol 2,3-dioxygenase-like lactoylglutathione lyase family enzyme
VVGRTPRHGARIPLVQVLFCPSRRCILLSPVLPASEVAMLRDAVVTTIVQVRDAQRALAFYRDRLGLHHTGRNAEGQEMFAIGGGSALALMPAADATPTGRTELSFEVANIVTEIHDLKRRGVEFADYDLPGLKTVDHVCVLGSEKAAWFLDPDGNVLCLHEPVPASTPIAGPSGT